MTKTPVKASKALLREAVAYDTRSSVPKSDQMPEQLATAGSQPR